MCKFICRRRSRADDHGLIADNASIENGKGV
jgi:hypothetical protein